MEEVQSPAKKSWSERIQDARQRVLDCEKELAAQREQFLLFVPNLVQSQTGRSGLRGLGRGQLGAQIEQIELEAWSSWPQKERTEWRFIQLSRHLLELKLLARNLASAIEFLVDLQRLQVESEQRKAATRPVTAG